MSQAIDNELRVENGSLIGAYRESRNPDQDTASVHNDDLARKMGLRGGPVAGSYHMDLLPPLLLEAFGRRWFEQGNLSLYFLNMTLDREPVRALAELPPAGSPDAQVEVRLEREDGMQVAKGTAAVGNPDAVSALCALDLDAPPDGELRILRRLKAGDSMGKSPVVYTPEEQIKRLAVITEKLDWYERDSPWSGAVVAPAGVVWLLYNLPTTSLAGNIADGLPFFGAIEIRNVNGPPLVDTNYIASGEVLAVGATKKTEYFWFESALDDESGIRIAEMRMLVRYMKASSSLYAGTS